MGMQSTILNRFSRLGVNHLRTGTQQQKVRFQLSNTSLPISAKYSKNIYDELEVQVIEPRGPHKATIVWMHGLGDSSAGFYSLFAQIAPNNTRIVLPNAPFRPITMNGGMTMRGWYDIKSLARLESDEDRQGIIKSCDLYHRLLDEEFSKTDKIICGGFSQGSAISLAGCLSYPKHKIEALICASGYTVLGKDLLGDRYQSVQDGLPIYIFHGKMDEVVPYHFAMTSYNELMDKKGDQIMVYTDRYQGHQVTDSQITQMLDIFNSHILGEF